MLTSLGMGSTCTHLLHMLLATNFYAITILKWYVPYGMFENQNQNAYKTNMSYLCKSTYLLCNEVSSPFEIPF